ncbi:hypothetical protein O6H91_03G069900 [Diphasiastrum complanatum]|uniref:Uncharacterized protein n=1 Tax=Diphasiastrum complanatum TaxID=34168 RepID=A0ACC2E7W1_DIPCM|nr:hypothetical protein O6H91_03G069900 [Diphasiastrum complanatum]
MAFIGRHVSQEAFGLLLIQPILFFILAFMLLEPRHPRRLGQIKQINRSIWPAAKKTWTTLKCPLVWKPTCYTFLSWAMCPDITEGLFYYYTNPTLGLGFSQEFIGVIFAVGSVLSFLGALIYHKGLKGLTFRSLLFWAQLFLFLSGMLDLILVTRFNKQLGIPDYFLAAGDESLAQALYRLKWMPIYILCARLCPAGIEGFFYALLVAIDLLGLRASEWGGSVLLKLTSVTRTNFKFLWVTVLIRNTLRLLPMVLLFLVPNITADGEVLPSELVGASEEIDTDDENIQLVLQEHPLKAVDKPNL